MNEKKERSSSRRAPASGSDFKAISAAATGLKERRDHELASLEDLLASPLSPGWDTPSADAYVLMNEARAVMQNDVNLIVRRGQWMRLKRRIADFGTSTNDWSSAAWTFVGIAAAALLALLAPNEVILIAAAASGMVAAALCFANSRQKRKSSRAEGEDIVNEMDTIDGSATLSRALER